MENRASYFFVGLFVFGVFFAALVFILWLGGYSKKESFDYYEIYTQESVSGLGVKAPVRLLGVEVGDVEDISIYSKDDLSVKILIKVKKGTPIKEDTLATLQLQGITGLQFIQLQGGSKNSPRLVAKNKGEIPVIKFKESFLAAIDRQSEHIFSLVKTADDKSKELLSEKNLKNIEILLQNLANTSANLDSTTLKIGKMADEVYSAARNLNTTLMGANKTIASIDKFATKASEKLDSYDELRLSLLANLELFKTLLLESNRLLVNLQRSPSDLLFKKVKPKPGPGE